MRTRPGRVQAGFTLLEVLLAVALFALISVIVFSALNNTRIATERMREQAEQLTGLERAYRHMQADFEGVVRRPVRDELGTRQPALRGATGGVPAVELTRGGWRNPAGLPRASLQRVTYGVEDGSLRRVHWAVLDRMQDSEPLEADLLDGVIDLRLRYMDESRQWYEFWPPPGRNDPTLLPLAVEAVLDTEQWGEVTWLFRIAG